MKRFLFAIACMFVIITPDARADGPPFSVDEILNTWVSVAVQTQRLDTGELRVTDCFDGAERRAPNEWLPFLPDLARLSPYLIRDLMPELRTINKIRPANDRFAIRLAAANKENWSPEVFRMLAELCWGVSLETQQETGDCTTGRCDCSPIGCDPPTVCGCETMPGTDASGMPLPCQPPRKLCNTTIVKDLKNTGGALDLNLR